MNNKILDDMMFSDIEQSELFDIEDIRHEEPELYQAIMGGTL